MLADYAERDYPTTKMNQTKNKPAINILVFPYRDLYFRHRYGNTVRDLQVVEVLRQNPRVKRLCLVNRPVSLYERLLGKRRSLLSREADLPHCWDSTSLDLWGPLLRRRWTEHCYDCQLKPIYLWASFPAEELNILLDFTPIAKIDYRCFPGYFYWYDLIDNFRKHNRFNHVECQKVAEKYDYVKAYADLVTGVTDDALYDFPVDRRFTVANGILERARDIIDNPGPYTFGFTGFVTDKFDVASIRTLLVDTPYRAAIYGRVLDKQTGKQLAALPNVDLLGEFSRQDISRIMSSFKVGLLPYREDKSHDESPIKLYDYLDYGKPVVTTMHFEIQNRFVLYCDPQNPQMVFKDITAVLQKLDNDNFLFRRQIRATIESNHLWSNKLEAILNHIVNYHYYSKRSIM